MPVQFLVIKCYESGLGVSASSLLHHKMPLNLNEPVLCLVTDRTRLGRVDIEGLLLLVRLAVTGGVDLVQLRERDLSDRDFSRLVRRAV